MPIVPCIEAPRVAQWSQFHPAYRGLRIPFGWGLRDQAVLIAVAIGRRLMGAGGRFPLEFID